MNKEDGPIPTSSMINQRTETSALKSKERKNYKQAIEKLKVNLQNETKGKGRRSTKSLLRKSSKGRSMISILKDPLDIDGVVNPLDIDHLKEELEEDDNVEDDVTRKALALVEIKVKEENSSKPVSIHPQKRDGVRIQESEEEESQGKERQFKVNGNGNMVNISNFKDNKRIAADPIWEHVTNKDCTKSNYSKGSVTCNYCGKTYPYGTVDQHLWGIHQIMVTRPSRNTKTHAKTAAHWEHMTEDPDNKFRCTCKLCGKSLSRISAAKHLRQRHGVGEQILCSFCGKSFRDTNTKNTHELTHTGNYQYFCSVCGKGFYQNWQLSNHMIRTHDESDEKPFQCSECGKAFKDRGRTFCQKCGRKIGALRRKNHLSRLSQKSKET